MALRPYWSGQIRLSLVSLPVNIYPALNRSRQIALHEIYRPTGERVRHLNVVDDKPVERADIVKGYEVEKGEYIILEPKEIEALKVPSKKILDIIQFVDADEIDPIYNESPYFVAPQDDKGEDAFTTIRDALRQTRKVGLGQLSIGGRERLCSIKPYGSGIMLETLRYEDEIRAADPYFSDISKSAIDKEQLDLAKELVKRKTAHFAPKKFHDHYREALQELINAKIEHRKPQEVKEERSSGKVINLMDALRKSLRSQEGEKTKPAKAKTVHNSEKTKAAKAKKGAHKRKSG